MKFLIYLYIMFSLSHPLFAQGREIKGKVYDQRTKEPVAGATIIVPETHLGTVSTQEGNFSLKLSENHHYLQVSFIGYQSESIEITSTGYYSIGLSPSMESLQEVIITANREASLRTQAPVAISKLSPKTIDEAKPISLYEVINKVPGVLMVNLNNEQHGMAIRQPMNYNAYYLYMEDGIGIRPMGVFNHNALLEINQFAISSIEVVKGPVSSIYGPEAVGGTVNIITQRPTAMPTAKVGLQFDQWGYRRLQFGAGAQVGKFGIYAGGLSSRQTGSWMANSDYDKINLNTRLEYHFSSDIRLIGTFMYGDYFSQTGGSVDSVAFYNRAYVSTSDFTYRKSKAIRSRLTLEKDWHPGARSFVTVFHRFNELGQNPAYGIRWNPSANPNTARGEINSNNFRSIGLLAQHSHEMGFLNSKLIAGGMVDRSPVDYWAYQLDLHAQPRQDGRSVEKFTIDRERPDIKLADYDAIILNAAGYLQYDFEAYENLRFSTGLRYDKMAFTYNNYLDQSSGETSYSRFTPKVGLTYDLGNSKGIYANYSQGFAPPGLTAIFRRRPNTDPAEFYYNLQPAQFQNYEAGGWAGFLNNALYLDLALYQMNGANELLNIRQPDNSFDYQSAGKTLHRGVELGVSSKPATEISIRWSGTYAIHQFVDFHISNRDTDKIQNLSGLDMPSAPRFTWNTEIHYYPKWFKDFRAALEWQHVDGWYQDQINTVKYEGYDILNFRTGYQWKGVEVFSNVMNLTNVLYATNATRGNNATDRSTFNPAAPRTLVVGIQYNFTGKKI